MKSSLACFLVVGQFACLAALLLCAPGLASASQEAGRVITLTPGVSVQRGAQLLPLTAQDAVWPGDTLITDASGRVRVLFGDGGSIALGSNTVFTLEAYVDEGSKPGFSGRMAKGLLRSITGKIVEQNPSGFALTTPEATIGIRGSIVSVRSGGGSTTVFVENTLRQVFVNNSNVPQLNKVTITPGQPASVTPITPQDRREIGRDLAFRGGNGSAAAAPEPGTGTAATVASDLTADANTLPDAPKLPDLPMADLATVDTALAPPLAPTTASISGTLTPDATSSIGSMSDYSGNFGFTVNLSTGAISNAQISASSVNYASGYGNGMSYNFSNGSGLMSGGGSGTFSISGFQGALLVGTTNFDSTAYPSFQNSRLTGSGDVRAPGGTVSGTYRIDGMDSTITDTSIWNIDYGDFSGTRQ